MTFILGSFNVIIYIIFISVSHPKKVILSQCIQVPQPSELKKWNWTCEENHDGFSTYTFVDEVTFSFFFANFGNVYVYRSKIYIYELNG